MAFLGKEYKLVSQENFEGFLKSTGVPDDKVQTFAAFKPSTKLVKNGDSYTYITQEMTGSKETTFKSGVEFEDSIGPQKTPIKTSYVVDGNTVTQTVKADKGTAIFKKEYNGDDLVVTITADSFDGVSKRYYKA